MKHVHGVAILTAYIGGALLVHATYILPPLGRFTTPVNPMPGSSRDRNPPNNNYPSTTPAHPSNSNFPDRTTSNSPAQAPENRLPRTSEDILEHIGYVKAMALRYYHDTGLVSTIPHIGIIAQRTLGPFLSSELPNADPWFAFQHHEMMLSLYVESVVESQKPPSIDFLQRLARSEDLQPLDQVELFVKHDGRVPRFFEEEAGEYGERMVVAYFLRQLGVPKILFPKVFAKDFVRRAAEAVQNDPEKLLRDFTDLLETNHRSRFERSGIPNHVELFFLHQLPREDDVDYGLRILKTVFSRRPGLYTLFYPLLFKKDTVLRSYWVTRGNGESRLDYAIRLLGLCAEAIKKVQMSGDPVSALTQTEMYEDRTLDYEGPGSQIGVVLGKIMSKEPGGGTPSRERPEQDMTRALS